jgi:hypothetical protein
MAKDINFHSAQDAQLVAEAKFAEAKALPPGPGQRRLLKEAGSYKVLAEVKGSLADELKPPQ